MTQGRVAQRYAEALLAAALESKTEKAVAEDVASVKRTIEGSRELRVLLKSPVIKREVKAQALNALFKGKVSETMLSFLGLIAEKGRESALEQMIERFIELNDERLGILTVRVSSGAELSEQQRKTIQERFAGLTGKTVTMDVAVDAGLRGGFLAQLGDTVYDGSIKRQLEIMREHFLEGNGTN